MIQVHNAISTRLDTALLTRWYGSYDIVISVWYVLSVFIWLTRKAIEGILMYLHTRIKLYAPREVLLVIGIFLSRFSQNKFWLMAFQSYLKPSHETTSEYFEICVPSSCCWQSGPSGPSNNVSQIKTWQKMCNNGFYNVSCSLGWHRHRQVNTLILLW